MNAKIFLNFVAAALATTIWFSPAIGGKTVADDHRAAYAKLVDCCIKCCDAKMRLHNSRSEKLRHTAEISCLKAAYLKNYREVIIQELIERNVKPELYKVQYIVNSMFYDILRREVSATHKGVIQVGYSPID